MKKATTSLYFSPGFQVMMTLHPDLVSDRLGFKLPETTSGTPVPAVLEKSTLVETTQALSDETDCAVRASKEAKRSQKMADDKQRLAAIGEFASMIAHEIRSPLSTIGMALDYLQGDALSEKALQRLKLAGDEKKRLESLLNEILLFAKPQQLISETLDLDTLVRETMQTILIGSETECCPIKYDDSGIQGPILVSGDRDKLKQVMINLLMNACQAIALDETVTVTMTADEISQTVSVQLCNPGHIPEQILARLCDPFFTTKCSGTGLGLAIVKRILDAHDGQLEIRSNSSNEVCVTVTLPTAATSQTADTLHFWPPIYPAQPYCS